MKFSLIFFALLLPASVFAQGIGVKPRTDIVMLSAVARDSLSDLVYSEIQDLKRYSESNNLDSAVLEMAYKDSGNLYTHSINLSNPAERQYAADELAKLGKLFHDYPDMRKQYYTVYKTKETPSGQRHTYVIVQSEGKKQRTVNWVFFPIGDKLLLGSF